MAIIRKSELKEMSSSELREKLQELQLELVKARGEAFAGAPKNPGRIRELRRTIARIKTLLHQRGEL